MMRTCKIWLVSCSLILIFLSLTSCNQAVTTGENITLQEGNNLNTSKIKNLRSSELPDNRIGGQWNGLSSLGGINTILSEEIIKVGLKRVRIAVNSCDVGHVDWDLPEFEIEEKYDDWITDMYEGGVKITYVLSFWDKEKWPQQPVQSRFSTEEDIESYLEFVKFIVNHFEGRVEYYELWNEPSVGEGCPEDTLGCLQHIKLEDYINLVRQTVPVIRQEDPEAKIIIGAIPGLWTEYGRDYLFGILNSEVMPMVDGISFHPMYATTPEDERWEEYYYNYPSFIGEIKEAAFASGFRGEFIADELTWWNPENAPQDQPWVPILPYSEIICARYYARAIVMHLGLDVTAELGGTSRFRKTTTSTIRNVCTVMAGVSVTEIPVEIQTDSSADIESYGFTQDNDKLLVIWEDNIATEEYSGVKVTLIIPGFSARQVIAIDVLNGLQQELVTSTEDGNLVIDNLIVKDYPIILRLVR